MLIIVLKPICNHIDKILSKLVHKNFNLNNTCIVIVAPPRSGSTIIYQAFVSSLKCLYFSNLHALFPSLATKYFFKSDDQTINKLGLNYYGHTFGWKGVNEGNDLFEKLFNLEPNKEKIQERFNIVLNELNGPYSNIIILKNVRWYHQIHKLIEAIPDLIIIRIKRDRYQILQSVIKAYHELGNFHPIPDKLSNKLSEYGYIKFAIMQILEIENYFDQLTHKYKNKNIIEISYEDFCKNHLKHIKYIAINVLNRPDIIRSNICLNELKPSTTQKIKDEELSILKSELDNILKMQNGFHGID